MKITYLAPWAVLALASSAATFAQAPEQNEPSVTLSVSPPQITPGGHVTLSGQGYPQAGTSMQITVTPPSGTPVTLNTTADADGRYSLIFGQTGTVGAYKVSAQAGAKGNPEHGAFSVAKIELDIDEDVADNKELLGEPGELVTAIKKGVDSVPDSPAKSAIEPKLDELSRQTAQLTQQSEQLAKALAPFKQMMLSNPDAGPALTPMFDHLAQLDEEAKTSKQTFAKEVADSQNASKVCDAIDHATTGLKAVPEMIGIIRKPFMFVLGFARSMAESELPERATPAAGAPAPTGGSAGASAAASEEAIAAKLVQAIPASVRATPGFKFAVAETKKFVPSITSGTKGPLDLFDKVTSLATDVLTYANEQLFAKYCDKFEGNFTATMQAHFFSKPNDQGLQIEWWTYSTAIKGKLTLRYPKEAAGKAVALSGQLEGGATRFTYKQDVWNSGLFGKIAQGGSVHEKNVAPAATDDASGGMVKSLTSPTAFFIPVTGQYADGKVTMTLGDARTDFNADYTVARTFYVVIAPTTLMLPVMGRFTLPYTNAHFILSHLIKDDFPVTTQGQTMMLRRTDNRDYPGRGNDAVYTFQLKACNPGC